VKTTVDGDGLPRARRALLQWRGNPHRPQSLLLPAPEFFFSIRRSGACAFCTAARDRICDPKILTRAAPTCVLAPAYRRRADVAPPAPWAVSSTRVNNAKQRQRSFSLTGAAAAPRPDPTPRSALALPPPPAAPLPPAAP